MKDFAALSAAIWTGALQAAAVIAAQSQPPGQYDPDEAAEQVLDLASRIIRKMSRYDSKMVAIAASLEEPH